MARALTILAVATKSPWPPVDGGRLVLQTTLEALRSAGHAVTLVCPVAPGGDEMSSLSEELSRCCEVQPVPVRRHSLPKAVLISLGKRLPFLVARHTYGEVRRQVAELLIRRRFDVIHVEQVQARANIPGGSSPPFVVRSHNVESDVARRYCEKLPLRPLYSVGLDHYAAWEGGAVADSAATVALTAEDARRLGELARGKGRVVHVAAPFPAQLPPAVQPLPGSPAVVLLAGQGWLPQREDAHWFLSEIWPRMHAALPGARLHVFGSSAGLPEATGARFVPDLEDSRCAFDASAILIVPMSRSFGVRMKVLEAWARGTPVVATPPAVRGLAAKDGENLLLGSDQDTLTDAVGRLHRDRSLVSRLRAGGTETLLAHHHPGLVARTLAAIYEGAAGVASEIEHG